jgi:hypothetical protein
LQHNPPWVSSSFSGICPSEEKLEDYAAKAPIDVDTNRSKISKATDQKGWKPLMGTYSSCINQLKNIIKFGADGKPRGDHGPSDSELRVWRLKGITNPHLDQIKVKAASDEYGTMCTYSDICEMVPSYSNRIHSGI